MRSSRPTFRQFNERTGELQCGGAWQRCLYQSWYRWATDNSNTPTQWERGGAGSEYRNTYVTLTSIGGVQIYPFLNKRYLWQFLELLLNYYLFILQIYIFGIIIFKYGVFEITYLDGDFNLTHLRCTVTG